MSGAPATGRASGHRWYALLLLALAYTCHSIDRQIVSVVIEPVKAEFQASDRAMGFLGGFAYALAFSAASLPVGWLIDRLSRKTLFAILLSVWSGLTFLCSFATSFLWLLLARMGVGAAEAGAQPVCLSLISDYFRPRERSTAIGYFYLSAAFGITASFLIGGLVAEHYGWRHAFQVAGAPGILVALLILATLVEPPRGQHEETAEREDAPASLGGFFGHVAKTPNLLHLAAGMTLTSLTVTAMWLWSTSLLIRVHGVSLGHAGPIVAIGATASALGSVVAGWIADRLARRDLRRLLIVPMLGTLLCVPFGIGFAYAPTLAVALACLFGTAFAMGAYLAPGYSFAMYLVPPGMRGVTSAGIQMLINLLGSGIGPVLTGLLSDRFGGGHSLQPAIAITMCVNLWAAFHFWQAYRCTAEAAAQPLFPER